MKQLLKHLIERTPFYFPLRSWYRRSRATSELKDWEKNGRPSPPPHVVKQRALRQYAQDHNLRILVETGTFRGDMVAAMLGSFDKIYSIELGPELFRTAKARFKRSHHVEILQGDSGTVLGDVIKRIHSPALFWLDGHYSAGVTAKGEADTPVFDELCHVLDHDIDGHVVMIDDARCFGVDPAYPTIEQLSEYVHTKAPNARINVCDDSIRITNLLKVGSPTLDSL